MNFDSWMGDGTTPGSAYDLNGNIKQMQQWGWMPGGSTQTDNLKYTYHLNGLTNRLKNVIDLNNNPTTQKNATTVKGTIIYTYDATGTKLKKIVVENGATISLNNINYTTNITTTTLYLGSSVYENKLYSNSTVNTALRYTHQLQFFGHEEGRVRAVRPTPQSTTPLTLVYDYMLKDHLGNPTWRGTGVRMPACLW